MWITQKVKVTGSIMIAFYLFGWMEKVSGFLYSRISVFAVDLVACAEHLFGILSFYLEIKNMQFVIYVFPFLLDAFRTDTLPGCMYLIQLYFALLLTRFI
jgi:hypothetical protein